MSEKDDGGPGPAVKFPDVTPTNGVSLRDWFAGQALIGILHNAEVFWPLAAHLAYQYADAMLLARSHQEDKQ